ncbi:MAG: GGDEF domain-containing protein [Planctomycetota bacterium]
MTNASGRVIWSDECFAELAYAAGVAVGDLARIALSSGAEAPDAGLPWPVERVDLSAAAGGSGPGEETWLLIRLDAPLLDPRSDQSAADDETDPTTGVLSRRAILARLEAACRPRPTAPFVVLFLDLDGFKTVNDRWGHLAGDACLAEIGRRLRGALRAGDCVGRFGGDEFLVLVHGPADADAAAPIERRLADAVAAPIGVRGETVLLGASIGVAAFDGGGPTDLIERADRAMYRQKSGRQEGANAQRASDGDVADPAELG